jgi:hypothetical protein
MITLSHSVRMYELSYIPPCTSLAIILTVIANAALLIFSIRVLTSNAGNEVIAVCASNAPPCSKSLRGLSGYIHALSCQSEGAMGQLDSREKQNELQALTGK